MISQGSVRRSVQVGNGYLTPPSPSFPVSLLINDDGVPSELLSVGLPRPVSRPTYSVSAIRSPVIMYIFFKHKISHQQQ